MEKSNKKNCKTTVTRPLLCTAMLLLLTTASFGQDKKEPAPKRQTTTKFSNPNMSEFVASIDVNKDGKMTHKEWSAKHAPESSFNGLSKGKGFVTKADLDSNPAPPGIDINKDGKVTVAEFLEFDKKMAKKPRTKK
jgi:hypothetical protein